MNLCSSLSFGCDDMAPSFWHTNAPAAEAICNASAATDKVNSESTNARFFLNNVAKKPAVNASL